MGHKLLIANRGEIALRILRSASALAIPTLSIFTEADASAKHVTLATETASVSSYTDQDALLAVCAMYGVTMLHPGYGFLSENHSFADKVEAAGIIFLGPRPAQILSMGLKHEARAAAQRAGVPVLPGSELVATLEAALEQAAAIGYPVMLKATGGGGGMGMAVCPTANDLQLAFERTVEMTKTLFADAGVFIEKYIPQARHIEIQVFGDGEGNVLDFGERECSVQRRHQKVLEEAGSPFISKHPALGIDMRAAAVRLCKLISYRSAGTVEFLVDDTTASFYFLELNSRIQVEHPVTEQVRPGLDLVGMMIELGLAQAGGGVATFALPEASRFSDAQGHAIEARIYAEIPHLAFKPAPGLLQEVSFPTDSWLRVESWVETGVFISPFYDPMIAKVIAWGSTREEARFRLNDALSRTVLRGTSTNLEYLQAILECDAFRRGDVTTSFLDTFQFVTPCVEFLDGGLATSVQDLRPRLTGDGIPRGGPMDELAFQAANILAGNPAETEQLEITMTGPTLRFTTAAVIAVTGASCDVYLDGVLKALWSRIVVPAGSVLEIDACEGSGSRAYLSIRGGFPEIPLYMGSKSTFTAGRFGGVQGRDIVAGDIILLSPSSSPTMADSDFTLPSGSIPVYPQAWSLAALPGPHADASYLAEGDLKILFSSIYSVTADANRLGVRLEGGTNLTFSRADGGEGGGHPSNTIDHGYTYGNLNMNGDTPVLFSRDSPDMGGFVCALTVASCDLWKLGQLRPDDKVKFAYVSLASIEAQRLHQTEWLASCAASLASESGDDFAFVLDSVSTSATSLADGIIKRVAADPSVCMPELTYRQSGDTGLLVEVGAQTTSFGTRVMTELWERNIRALSLPGVYSFGQGAASLIVRYDQTLTTQAAVLAGMVSASDRIGIDAQGVDIDCRRVHLPIVFDDSVSKATIARYMQSSGRTDAVYLPSNAEYLAEASGFPDVDTMVTAFAATDWYVSARAFFCGLPFLQPIDPRASLVSQKYNPSRTFTPAGTIGFAGATAAIYPVDSPGGYQLLGRTLTPWKPWAIEYEDHFLLKSFDIIHWIPMAEEAFDQIEKEFNSGKYEVKIEAFSLSARDMAALEASTAEEAGALKAIQRANMARLGAKESRLFNVYQAAVEAAARADASSGKPARGSQSGLPLKSPVHAVVRSLCVAVGETLLEGQEVARVEAMKTEISVKVPRKLIGKVVGSIAAGPGDMLKPGEAIMFCE